VFNEEVVHQISELTDLTTESFTETNQAIFNTEIKDELAGFLHRGSTVSAPNATCPVRVRLTPSNPSKRGAMWYREEVAVYDGFETYFTYQISDHSKECTIHRDQYFSQFHHRTCSVRGADGFAFVIHYDEDGTEDAIGGYGGNLGYGGMRNSLAIAFDMWQNPGFDLIGEDHVSFQSRGQEPNDPFEPGLLGLPRSTPIADGVVHTAKIKYFNNLRPEYLDYIVASDTLMPYLLDNGEQKRIGTLVVFVDDGIASDTPLMAMPINLSLLIKLPADKAFVGFTSATGRFFAKQDILSWYWCDESPCNPVLKSDFDYHHKNLKTTAQKQSYGPGEGFGGGDARDGFPTINQSPDTTPWEAEKTYFANNEPVGLSADATLQVPDATLY
jgi:hypothetical protein